MVLFPAKKGDARVSFTWKPEDYAREEKGSKKQKRQIKEARTTVTGEKDAQRDELLLDDNMLEVRPLFDTCV